MRSKKIFYNILLFIISIGLFSSCSYKNNQLLQKDSKFILVKGNAVINVMPDIAILDLHISTTGKNIKNILSENNRDLDNVVDTIIKLGVDKKDIYKSYFNFQPNYDDTYKISSELPVMVTAISIKVKDINKLGKIVYEAEKVGAYVATPIRFTVSDYDKYYKEALNNAIKDGNNKAKDLSKSLGIDLGTAVKIDENQNYTDSNENNNYTNNKYSEKSNSIMGENILIKAAVKMTFQY